MALLNKITRNLPSLIKPKFRPIIRTSDALDRLYKESIEGQANKILGRFQMSSSTSPMPKQQQQQQQINSINFDELDDLFTVEDLFKARVHFGHKETMLNGHMRPFIFGKRLGVLVFDLEQTTRLLRHALKVTAEIAYRGGVILFIFGSRQSGHLVEEAAKECGEYAYCRKWRNQIFTNSQKLFGTVTRLPDLVVMFSTMNMGYTHRAVFMSAKTLIPVVGVVDTNSDPRLITYPVPGNDDSPQSIALYCHLFKSAVLRGKAKRKEIVETYGEEFYNKTLESS